MNHREKINAMIMPTSGANKIKEAVFITGAELIALKVPAWAIAAPAKPPINVWDEEEGIPDHQVSKFQIIAAINPEKTTSRVIHSCFTVFAMVSATPWSLKIKYATILNKAAHNTAWKGVSTFVETTVAIELAAS
jgi:hypothetical protein